MREDERDKKKAKEASEERTPLLLIAMNVSIISRRTSGMDGRMRMWNDKGNALIISQKRGKVY